MRSKLMQLSRFMKALKLMFETDKRKKKRKENKAFYDLHYKHNQQLKKDIEELGRWLGHDKGE